MRPHEMEAWPDSSGENAGFAASKGLAFSAALVFSRIADESGGTAGCPWQACRTSARLWCEHPGPATALPPPVGACIPSELEISSGLELRFSPIIRAKLFANLTVSQDSKQYSETEDIKEPIASCTKSSHPRPCAISDRVCLQVRRTELFPEHLERKLDDEEEDASARGEPEDLGEEARVERAEAFFARDEGEGGEGPVVLGRLAGDLVARRARGADGSRGGDQTL